MNEININEKKHEKKMANPGFITLIAGIFLLIITTPLAIWSVLVVIIEIIEYGLNSPLFLFFYLLIYGAIAFWMTVGVFSILCFKRKTTFRVGVSIVWVLFTPIGIFTLIDSAVDRIQRQ